MKQFDIRVNGTDRKVLADDDTPLLWVLREELGLTGTKYACGVAQCGACTVHLAGNAMRSCVFPIGAVGTQEVTTIEGLGAGSPHPLQRAWVAEQVSQCGYCQSGMIMAAAALLAARPAPTDRDIDENVTNLCRCGTYGRIRAAIHRAAKERG